LNINDIQAPSDRPEELLKAIFDKQRELLLKYRPIEKANGLLHTEDIPVNLNCRFGQAQLKDLAWRMTEEITEATDAREHRDHYLEELVDALHFMVELMILADFQPCRDLTFYFDQTHDMFREFEHEVTIAPYAIVERIGCAMNCLKNKPWKQSQMLTDHHKFKGHLEEAWITFIGLMVCEGLDANDLYDLYFRKSEVNAFRQRSNY
jgi:hypothetical protein